MKKATVIDWSKASLESGHQLHRFHENFNRTLKMNVIAINILKTELDKGLTAAQIKQRVYDTGELWGGMPAWQNPMALLDKLRYDIGTNGVVRAYSAFDVFLDKLQAELDSYEAYRNAQKNPGTLEAIGKSGERTGTEVEKESDEVDRLFRYLERKHWVLRNEQYYRPVFTYYRLSRNCIAHRNGLVSNVLANHSSSEELKLAVQKWRTITKDIAEPPIQHLRLNKVLLFTHRDAIFSCSVNRMIALQMTNFAVKEIGLTGMIYLIAKNQLQNETTLPTTHGLRTVHSYFKWKLTDYCRVEWPTPTEIRECLDELNLWKSCDNKFKELKKKK